MEGEILHIFAFSVGEKKDRRLMPAPQNFSYVMVGFSLSLNCVRLSDPSKWCGVLSPYYCLK